MCRVFGCVAAEPVSVRHELLEADNPIIRQSEEHDSGWGMVVYGGRGGGGPLQLRFPRAAHADHGFTAATETRGRIFNVHVRHATIGGLSLENTHPFCLGSYSFSHNGTVLSPARLVEPGMAAPAGETDTERLFLRLLQRYAAADPIGSLRRAVSFVVEHSAFSGLNFLFSDGDRLFAYRLGIFELHWLPRPGQLLVSSERLTDERWHSVQQDVLLVLDPDDLEEPHAERLVGDELVAAADVRKLDGGAGLRGAERGAFAAERAARLAAPANE